MTSEPRWKDSLIPPQPDDTPESWLVDAVRWIHIARRPATAPESRRRLLARAGGAIRAHRKSLGAHAARVDPWPYGDLAAVLRAAGVQAARAAFQTAPMWAAEDCRDAEAALRTLWHLQQDRTA